MKKWIGSRLNRKLCLCFLIVSLIPLCLVYFYINSRYSEKLRSDAVVLNQLAEKNTAILLEDYLTKIEYISNLFYDNDVQAIVRGAVGPLDNYNARQLLEKKVRVNLDLFHILDDVDQVTFLRHNGDNHYKLIYYQNRDYGEFYDLSNDPHEKYNLWDDPSVQKEKARLMCRLADHMIDLGENGRQV